MSRAEIGHFPGHRLQPKANDDHAANAARKRLAELPDQYQDAAMPRRETLAGKLQPVSPAANAAAPVTAPAAPTAVAETSSLAQGPTSSPSGASAAEADVHPEAKAKAKTRHSRHHLLPSRLKPVAIGVLTFALILLVFKAPIFLQQVSYLTHKPAAAPPATPAVTASAPPSLAIPKVNVTAPIIFASSNVEASIQKDLQSGVVHYAGTANPGENGNSVIFGHSSNDWWEPGNYKFVFVLLDKLVVGDTFTANYNGTQYVYQVTETKVVEPTDVSVLGGSGVPEMTLITCTPPGTSWKRLVVRAKQTSPAPKAETVAVRGDGARGSLPSGTSSFTDQIGNLWQSITSFFSGN